MQGGVVGAANTAGLESLGTVAYEPLWWFRRSENQGVGADGLRGRKIAIGPPGSGTRVLSLELIKRTGTERQSANSWRWARAKPRKSSRRERSMSRS